MIIVCELEDLPCRLLETRVIPKQGKPTPWKSCEKWKIKNTRLRDLAPVWRENREWRLRT